MAEALEKNKPVSWTEPVKEPEPVIDTPPKKEYQIVDDARYELIKNEFAYPFDKLQIGQGFFVSIEDDNTVAKLVVAMSKQVNQYCVQNSQVEKNEEGDDILETLTINTRLRNPDGSFKLDGEGVPKVSIATVLRPRLIGPKFMVRAVYKDAEIADDVKSEKDGVLVIRLD